MKLKNYRKDQKIKTSKMKNKFFKQVTMSKDEMGNFEKEELKKEKKNN